MATQGIDATVALTGVLPFVVLVAALLSLPVCLGLLRLYKRSVLAGMNARVGDAVEPASVPPPLPPAVPLRVVELGSRQPVGEIGPLDVLDAHGSGAAEADPRVLRRASRGPWQAALVYALGGLGYAAIMTVGWLLATDDSQWLPAKLALLSWTYFWPVLPAALIVAAYDGRRRTGLLVLYFSVLGALMLVALARSPGLGWLQLPLYWLITNGPATLLVACFLWRPIRAVGPLVLCFLLLLAVGSQSLVSLAGSNEAVLAAIADAGFELGLGARGVFVAMILVGILAFAGLGWPLLRWLGRRYEARKFSDQSITVDALFLLFAVVQSIGLAFQGAAWILTGLVAFAGFKAATLAGFAALRGSVNGRTGESEPRSLLWLRVFRLGKRSERLFDRFRRHWQPIGGIRMIAGPDLVTGTVEPHEFLDFVGGRLARRFIGGPAELDRRIAAIDDRPDPDGRHRIDEFFCRADTWQAAMRRLALASDAVLMDLRSFSASNEGCRFELGSLLDSVDLRRVIVLVDDRTDRRHLAATLHELWSSTLPGSPNRLAARPELRSFVVGHQSQAEIVALVQQLLAAAPRTASGERAARAEAWSG